MARSDAIEQVRVEPVNIPLKAPIRWAWGVRTGVTRNIVLMRTQAGVEGIGETQGGTAVQDLLVSLGTQLIGGSPFDFEAALADYQLTAYFSGYNGLSAVGGLEMALWDLMGKIRGCPVYDLLGGSYPRTVEFSAYVFRRYRKEDTGGETTPEEIGAWCRNLATCNGFRVFKLKAGVLD